jgi:hypothetical protein
MTRDDRGRLVVAAAVTLTAVLFVLELVARPNVFTDFEVLWRGARVWQSGGNPYAMKPCCLFYPLPALMLVWPVHSLPLGLADAIFVAVPAGILSWRLSRHGLWPLLALASPSFVMAAILGQWTPWLLLAMIWPTLGFFFASKPTLGLACFLQRPSWRALASALAFVLLSLALRPSWPLEWLRNLPAVVEHPAPIAAPFGWLLAFALLRWRQREARLLLAMACVPQLLLFADQLPLMLIARSRLEAAVLAIGGWVAAIFWFVQESEKFGAVSFAAPYVLTGCYLPALWIVLRRPNSGSVPHWVTGKIAGWPDWLRGSPGVREDTMEATASTSKATSHLQSESAA